MKAITLRSVITLIFVSFIQNKTRAQAVNWETISQQNKHLVHANTGAEYGLTAGLGYHHVIPVKSFPLWMGFEFSMPLGSPLADDFKLRPGAQIRIVALHHLQLSVRAQGIARRNRNPSVTLFNFGADVAGTIGYYRKHWFLAAEAGFDKAIVTHFRHSEWYKGNIYSDVQDGWYKPASGGNFYYGLQGGYSLKKADITLKAGKILQQDFRSQPLLPFYGQLGVNFRF